MDLIVVSVLMGIGAGILSTFFGLGGGILFVSILPIVFGYSQSLANGTSLFAVFLLVSINTFKFHRKNLVKWEKLIVLIPSAAVASFFGGQVANQISERNLVLFLAMTLLTLGVWTFLKKNKAGGKPRGGMITSFVGLLSGFISGLTGLGAGAINSAFLLNWKIVEPREVAPTSNGIMLFATFFAVLSYFKAPSPNWPIWGNVHIEQGLFLFGAAFLSASFGYKYQSHLPDKWRKLGLGALLLGLGLRAFYRYTSL